MATKLVSMSIAPAKNGGFTVTHHYKPRGQYATGKQGGFSMAMPASEDHVFGPNEHAALVAHIAKNLGLSQAREEEAEVGGRLARSAGMRAARQQEAEVGGRV
jgi:hypothetical protein